MGTPLKTGEVYRCSDPACGCEIRVTKGPECCPASNPAPPRCCCGKEMKKKD